VIVQSNLECTAENIHNLFGKVRPVWLTVLLSFHPGSFEVVDLFGQLTTFLGQAGYDLERLITVWESLVQTSGDGE
jgi:hypothetical protein